MNDQAPADQDVRLFAGIMTGTSLDAIDVAIVEIGPPCSGQESQHIRLRHFHSQPMEPAMMGAMMALQASGGDEIHRAALVSNTLADAIGAAVSSALASSGLPASDIAALGVHGQTVRHQPRLGYTTQLNAPARIAESTGITVVSDFRSRDVAAGGQGAPLVPVFHQAIFARDPSIRAVVNIGGIANLTWLEAPILGYDTGPGNMLMDLWIRRHSGLPFDDQGAWASVGRMHKSLLRAMLGDPFFSFMPPRSTGRDLFSAEWLDAFLCQSEFSRIAPEDVQATLLRLTARSIALEIQRIETTPSLRKRQRCSRLLVCGGGARNTALMKAIHAELEIALRRSVFVEPTTACGWDPQTIEAAAFAWLASRTLDRLPGNLPSVTGARGERILGSITPA